MSGSLVVHVSHSYSDPRFTCGANKAVLCCIPSLESFDDFVNVLVVFFLTFLVGLCFRPDIAKIGEEVQCGRDGKDDEDDDDPSELDKVINPYLLSLGTY